MTGVQTCALPISNGLAVWFLLGGVELGNKVNQHVLDIAHDRDVDFHALGN